MVEKATQAQGTNTPEELSEQSALAIGQQSIRIRLTKDLVRPDGSEWIRPISSLHELRASCRGCAVDVPERTALLTAERKSMVPVY